MRSITHHLTLEKNIKKDSQVTPMRGTAQLASPPKEVSSIEVLSVKSSKNTKRRCSRDTSRPSAASQWYSHSSTQLAHLLPALSSSTFSVKSFDSCGQELFELNASTPVLRVRETPPNYFSSLYCWRKCTQVFTKSSGRQHGQITQKDSSYYYGLNSAFCTNISSRRKEEY